MNSDLLKLVAPMVFVFIWLDFCRKNRSMYLIGATLFFTSIAAFSQNFSFIYREIHQAIQVLIILFTLRVLMRTNKLHRVNLIFLVFFAFIGISLISSGIDDDARGQFINFLVVIGVTNYLYKSISSASRMQLLIEFIGRLAVFSSIIGLIEFLANTSQRIEGTFANPNYYAFFLGIGFCAIFQRISSLRRNLSLALILMAMILSGSRAALAFPIMQFVWHVYCLKNLRSLVIYGVLGLFIIVALTASELTRFSDVQASEGSDAERIIFAKIAYKMASDHPLTGVGWGRYISEFGNYSSSAERIFTSSGVVDAEDQDRRVTHNDYVRILAELGWIAFFASIISLFVGFAKFLKNKDNEIAYIFPIWLGVVIFSFAHNNLNTALFWFFFLLPFYYFRGVSAFKVY